MEMKRYKLTSKLFFVLGGINLIYVIIVKLFLKNPDIGARFKNFNKPFYVSELYFFIGLIWLFFSFVYLLNDHFNKSILSEKLEKMHFYSTLPWIIILFLTPILDTYFPTKIGTEGSSLESLFVFIGAFSFVAFLIGLISFTINIIKGLFRIPRLFNK
jgi:hypothetical protein